MHLIGSPTSPYVRKVRVYLEETGAACEFAPVDAWQPNAALLAAAPLGKVPVLVRDEGSPLFDSLLVIEYLDRTLPEARRLIPAVGEPRWDVLRWQALAHGLIDATVMRLLDLRRPEALRSREVQAREEVRIARSLARQHRQGCSRTAMAVPRPSHARRCRSRRCFAVYRFPLSPRLAHGAPGAGTVGSTHDLPTELRQDAAARFHASGLNRCMGDQGASQQRVSIARGHG